MWKDFTKTLLKNSILTMAQSDIPIWDCNGWSRGWNGEGRQPLIGVLPAAFHQPYRRVQAAPDDDDDGDVFTG